MTGFLDLRVVVFKEQPALHVQRITKRTRILMLMSYFIKMSAVHHCHLFIFWLDVVCTVS